MAIFSEYTRGVNTVFSDMRALAQATPKYLELWVSLHLNQVDLFVTEKFAGITFLISRVLTRSK